MGGFSPDGIPFPAWRGCWVGGICGQRAFCKTPYGPFWVTPQKELMTYGPSGPIVAWTEYQAGLLAAITEANMDQVELVYHRDAARNIDRIYICLGPANVLVVHDFILGGQGYAYQYSNLTPNIFARDCQFRLGGTAAVPGISLTPTQGWMQEIKQNPELGFCAERQVTSQNGKVLRNETLFGCWGNFA